ncbi:MAG TPA: imidazole glycerol phosphate synthase cyclase subunit [Lentisphaeria bacterium]|nr:MAG: hypothetical protein A2X47_09200 [Lentisphaerae bacterium GWF2_38_69]HBM15425.1 imidazole glycerol phosphate synthase cyclase subunit [Lentisphaeria bacterium]
MLKDRLIFSLLMQKGEYMLGRNFRLQRVGDLQWIKDNYDVDSILYSIDELVVLNVDRGDKDIAIFVEHLAKLTRHCFMPVAAGGGIASLEDAYTILNAGADKLIVNTVLIKNKPLLKDLVRSFGSQCIVGSIDFKKDGSYIRTFIKNGLEDSGLNLDQAIDNAIELGVGEIYLNSMDREGTGQGLELDIVRHVSERSSVPVIAAGGIERTDQFHEGIKKTGVKAVAASDLFYFMGDSLSKARNTMCLNGCDMAKWGDIAEFFQLQQEGKG